MVLIFLTIKICIALLAVLSILECFNCEDIISTIIIMIYNYAQITLLDGFCFFFTWPRILNV